ncbi:MAG TPA: glycerophosphodiester phosphodiesterase [Kofleriaceae bacterium]|nr:glycerophosphodiester phosphodiesterase [Kofleriaceae bacterium]
MSAQGPILYAHRGAASELPENTLAAFERGLAAGAGALEMDLHMTADGHIVVSHDPSGARMCGVDSEIRRATLAEVKRWDAGFGFVAGDGSRPHAGCGHTIPTLGEVLDAFPAVRLNVDLKQVRPAMAREAVAVIRRHGAEARVTLASFRLAPLLTARRLGYRGPTALSQIEVALLLYTPMALFRRLPLTGQCVQIPTHARGLVLACREIIDKCHSLGLRVDFWTINDPAEAKRLLALGADGIMTDDPAAIAPVFGQ